MYESDQSLEPQRLQRSLREIPVMRAAERHRSLEAQLAARERHREQAIREECLRNRAINAAIAEDEAVHPRHALRPYGLEDDDEDEEPLAGRPQVGHFDHPEWCDDYPVDPLELEARAIRGDCARHAELVTGMIESCVPILLMCAKHALTSVTEGRRYVELYLTWRHAVIRLWSPPSDAGLDWLARMRANTQRLMIDRVERSDEFKAVRRMLDRARKSTDEYRASEAEAQRERRKKPEVKKANAAASKLRMQKYRARLAAKAQG